MVLFLLHHTVWYEFFTAGPRWSGTVPHPDPDPQNTSSVNSRMSPDVEPRQDSRTWCKSGVKVYVFILRHPSLRSLPHEPVCSHVHLFTHFLFHGASSCRPISPPQSTISQFARDLNAVKNGSSSLIAFDNNFVKAPLAAGERAVPSAAVAN